MTKITLEKPTLVHAAEYLAMVSEFEAAGEGYPFNNVPLARHDFAAFLVELENEAQGIDLPPGVPAQETWLLLEDGHFVVGEFRFRPLVPEPLERWNGHVGYNIRPSRRRRNYATTGLSLLLDRARQKQLPGLFVPINSHNRASRAVVVKFGAEVVREVPDGPNSLACYWISLAHEHGVGLQDQKGGTTE